MVGCDTIAERERDRERQRERQRETETEKDRQTETKRQRDRERQRQTDRERQRETETDRQTGSEIEKLDTKKTCLGYVCCAFKNNRLLGAHTLLNLAQTTNHEYDTKGHVYAIFRSRLHLPKGQSTNSTGRRGRKRKQEKRKGKRKKKCQTHPMSHNTPKM